MRNLSYINKYLNTSHRWRCKEKEEEYFSDTEYVSKSMLDLINKSPAHLKTYIENHGKYDVDSAALRFGRMTHKFILENDKFFNHYAILPTDINKRTNEGKSKYKEFIYNNSGKEVITESEINDLDKLYEIFLSNPFARSLLENSEKEISCRWNSEIENIRCKAKADGYSEKNDFVFDLKTFDSRMSIQDSIEKYRYNVQAVHYTEGFKVKNFYLIALSKNFDCCEVIELSKNLLNEGKFLREKNLYSFRQFLTDEGIEGWDFPRILDSRHYDEVEFDL